MRAWWLATLSGSAYCPCLLGPATHLQVIESIFYMWRATHDPKWRDMGWRMWQAIEAHCRWEGGYSGALDAMQVGENGAPLGTQLVYERPPLPRTVCACRSSWQES